LSPKQTRWMTYLSRFNFQLEYVRGVDNSAADALSRHPAFGAVVTRRQAQAVTGGGEIRPRPPAGPRAVTVADEPVIRTPVIVQPSAHGSAGTPVSGKTMLRRRSANATRSFGPISG
jgi:hypothetical protein